MEAKQKLDKRDLSDVCEACESTKTRTGSPSRRDKIWELDPIWHCMIVGTCLTLSDLRSLCRKLDYQFDPAKVTDYQIHGHFVSEAENSNRAGKLINKLLDRKHAGALRRFAKAKTSEEVKALWEAAFDAGEIPGPLWAAATHPALDKDLGSRIYGDVHMLSHLVGAANRADVRNQKQLEQANATLSDKLEREIRRRQAHAEKNQELSAKLAEEQAAGERTRQRVRRLEEQLLVLSKADERDGGAAFNGTGERSLHTLQAQVDQQEDLIERLSEDLRQAQQRAESMAAECAALEQVVHRDWGDDLAADGAQGGRCPFNFDGRCILYVGGITNVVCKAREFVQQCNGIFIHHDGGMEKSIDELASAVARADTVVFPTDCVSHSAVKKLKILCQRNMKPYVPLRTAGLSSFVSGLTSDDSPLIQ